MTSRPSILRSITNEANAVAETNDSPNEDSKSYDVKNPIIVTTASIDTIRGSSLYQISIPEDLEEKRYGALFGYLARRDVIPLGLYRDLTPGSAAAGKSENSLPYVFTNPPPDTELMDSDRVFVLSQKPLVSMMQQTKVRWTCSSALALSDRVVAICEFRPQASQRHSY